jgi:predicted RNA binding protein YcfA (HicA-like mRNA interferase family)
MPQSVKYRQLIKFFKERGFLFARQKGSHERWIHPDGRKITIPKHKEIAYGTFTAICEQAHISPQEFFLWR